MNEIFFKIEKIDQLDAQRARALAWPGPAQSRISQSGSAQLAVCKAPKAGNMLEREPQPRNATVDGTSENNDYQSLKT